MGYTDVSPGGFDDSKELLEGRNLGARYGGDSSQTEFLNRSSAGNLRNTDDRGYGGNEERESARYQDRAPAGYINDRRQNRSFENNRRDQDDAPNSYRPPPGNYRGRRPGGGYGFREDGGYYDDQSRGQRNPPRRPQQQQQLPPYASNRPTPSRRRRGSPYAEDSPPNNYRSSRRRGESSHLQYTSYRGPRADRSRSPFESSRGGEAAVAAEKRLNDLRQRLSVVDGAIAELRGSVVTTDN